MLDLISQALRPDLDTRGLSVVRIDGSCTLQQRRDALDKFNLDDKCVVMLATIGAVGEGYVCPIKHFHLRGALLLTKTTNLAASVDLSIASEVHIVEPHWNPMVEAQAVDRVHRIGQKKSVKITRYLVKASVEEVSLTLDPHV